LRSRFGGLLVASALAVTVLLVASCESRPSDAEPSGRVTGGVESGRAEPERVVESSMPPGSATAADRGPREDAVLGPGVRVIAPPIPDPIALVELVDLDGLTHRPLRPSGSTTAHVLVFVLADCPIANAFVPELSAIERDSSARGVRFFIVHVDPDVTPAAARKHASDFGIRMPVLIDRDHSLVAAIGATVTPETAIVTPSGDIAYRGRIDDRFGALGKKRPAPTKRDLRDALDAVIAGRRVAIARTAAVGCYIPVIVPADGGPKPLELSR
jgi:hypothetical protein